MQADFCQSTAAAAAGESTSTTFFGCFACRTLAAGILVHFDGTVSRCGAGHRLLRPVADARTALTRHPVHAHESEITGWTS